GEQRAARDVVGLEIAAGHPEAPDAVRHVAESRRLAGGQVRVGLTYADADPELARVVAAATGIARISVGAGDDALVLHLWGGALAVRDVELGVAVGPLGTAARDEAAPRGRSQAGARDRPDQRPAEQGGPDNAATLHATLVLHELADEQSTCRGTAASHGSCPG